MTQTIGAFLPCYKNPLATYNCIEQFRKYYPDNTLVVACDGGYNYTEMCKHFNCIYKHYEKNINAVYTDIDKTDPLRELLERIKDCHRLIPEEYVLWLEDDVFVNGRIEDTFKYDINGYCPNKFNTKTIEALSYKYQHLDLCTEYVWSGHGGSVYKTDSVIRNLQNDVIIDDILHQWRYLNLPTNICYDIFMSLLTILNKGTIGPYNGHIDVVNNVVSVNEPILHQYKALYGMDLPSHLKHFISKNE